MTTTWSFTRAVTVIAWDSNELLHRGAWVEYFQLLEMTSTSTLPKLTRGVREGEVVRESSKGC